MMSDFQNTGHETHKGPNFALVGDVDRWLSSLADKLERPVLGVLLDVRVLKIASDQTLSVEDGVLRVGGIGVLGRVTNTVSECKSGEIAYDDTYSLSSSVNDTQEGVIR